MLRQTQSSVAFTGDGVWFKTWKLPVFSPLNIGTEMCKWLCQHCSEGSVEEPLLMAPSGALLLVFPSLCSSFWEKQDSARALRPLQETAEEPWAIIAVGICFILPIFPHQFGVSGWWSFWGLLIPILRTPLISSEILSQRESSSTIRWGDYSVGFNGTHTGSVLPLGSWSAYCFWHVYIPLQASQHIYQKVNVNCLNSHFQWVNAVQICVSQSSL